MNDSEPPDLVLLQTFYEVTRTGSVTRAARNLGRSQPAVSARLRALEADFGVRLFEKVGRHLQLTEHGRRLQVECLDLMARSQHVRERVTGSAASVEGRVTIGTLPTVASHLLAPVLHDLFEEHPGVSITLRFDGIGSLHDRLRSGELDVLVVVGGVDFESVDVEPVGQATLTAVIAPDRAPEGPDPVTPERLRRLRYLSYGVQRDPTFDLIDRFAREHGLVGPRTPHVPHIETLRELVARGAGYTLLPAYTARRDRRAGRLAFMDVQGLDGGVDVSVVGRREQVMTPALEVVRASLSDLREALSD